MFNLAFNLFIILSFPSSLHSVWPYAMVFTSSYFHLPFDNNKSTSFFNLNIRMSGMVTYFDFKPFERTNQSISK